MCIRDRGRNIDVERSPSFPTRTTISQPSLPLTDSQENLSQVKEILKQQLADALYADISEIEEDKKFVDLGLDSIVGVEWITNINKTYNLNIKATKFTDGGSCIHGAEAAWLGRAGSCGGFLRQRVALSAPAARAALSAPAARGPLGLSPRRSSFRAEPAGKK